MDSMFSKVILAIWLIILLLALLLSFLAPAAYAQGSGGCPVEPIISLQRQNSFFQAPPYEVIISIQLGAAIPENPEPTTVARGGYYTNTVSLDYQPGTTVILSSSRSGLGPSCTDEIVFIESSDGQALWLSYRSVDNMRIEPRQPLDVTALFTKAGPTSITISYIDSTPDRYSSSPYFLTVVDSQSLRLQPARADIFPLITITPTKMPIAWPGYVYEAEKGLTDQAKAQRVTDTQTATVVSTSTPTPSSTPVTVVKYVPILVPVEKSPPQSVEEMLIAGWSGRLLGEWWLLWSVLVVGLVGLAVIGRRVLNRKKMWGGIRVEDENGKLIGEYDLAGYHNKFTIGYGPPADVVMPRADDDPDTGEFLAVFRNWKDEFGSREMILERLDVDGLAEEDRVRPLFHGSQIVIKSVVITYFDWRPDGDDEDEVIEATEDWL